MAALYLLLALSLKLTIAYPAIRTKEYYTIVQDEHNLGVGPDSYRKYLYRTVEVGPLTPVDPSHPKVFHTIATDGDYQKWHFETVDNNGEPAHYIIVNKATGFLLTALHTEFAEPEFVVAARLPEPDHQRQQVFHIQKSNSSVRYRPKYAISLAHYDPKIFLTSSGTPDILDLRKKVYGFRRLVETGLWSLKPQPCDPHPEKVYHLRHYLTVSYLNTLPPNSPVAINYKHAGAEKFRDEITTDRFKFISSSFDKSVFHIYSFGTKAYLDAGNRISFGSPLSSNETYFAEKKPSLLWYITPIKGQTTCMVGNMASRRYLGLADQEMIDGVKTVVQKEETPVIEDVWDLEPEEELER